jgi:acyl dehydratase
MGTTTRTITAFLDGEDSPTISNPIHSTGVAQQYGFRAALVGGVTVYGWCVPAILEALGEGWLDRGWAEIAFRRPVYPGDAMTARVSGEGGVRELEMANGEGEVCIRGTVGLGDGPFLAELRSPRRRTPEPPANPKPELTLATAATGQDLAPMFVPFPPDDARAYARELQRDEHPRWTGERPRLHPGWLAARMTPLIKHSYWYGPSIHARSAIQHTAPAYAGRGVTVAGHFNRAFEAKGHHYAEVDGVILDDAGVEVARIRHTTIFRPRMAAG